VADRDAPLFYLVSGAERRRRLTDGLVRGGVNQNFGSESCVSWLLSLLTMHEMQPAEAPDPSPGTGAADGNAGSLPREEEELQAALS
jgi:hypothetical protein